MAISGNPHSPGPLEFPGTPLVGSLVNRGNEATPLLQGLHQTFDLATMIGYKTSYG